VITVDKKALTIFGIGAADKDYDGMTATAITGIHNAVIIGKIAGDDVLIDTANAVATFSDSTVGTDKTVTFGGFSLKGADAGNYTLTQPAPAKAEIRQANPDFILPRGLTATEGERLADIKLPADTNGVFTFDAPLTTPVGTAGEHNFTITFTPYDTLNYKTVSGMVVVIKVTGSPTTSSAAASVTSKPSSSSTALVSSATSNVASDVTAPEMGSPASYLTLLLVLLLSFAGFILLKLRKTERI